MKRYQKYFGILLILSVLTVGIAMAIPAGTKIPEKAEKTLDDKFLDVAAKAPGFGGMFIEGDVLNIYLTNPSQKSAAEDAIASAFGRERTKNVQVLQGKYNFAQLKKWQDDAGILFDQSDIVYIDADEKLNRISIGVTNKALFSTIEKRLIQAGIPKDAFVVEETEPVVYKYTLQDRIRPLQGGIQIRFSNYLCTQSFNGIRSGANGFVTNSHCTNKQGGVQDTQYYQPLDMILDDFIGIEVADPLYTKSKCPSSIRGKVCRYSDSAYVSRASGVSGDLGIIEKTNSVNTGSLTVASDFRITNEGASYVGEIVNKVGRTTGWSQGSVTRTCVNTGVLGSKVMLLCQDWVNAKVGSGDSGSPVFAITNNPQTDDVSLRGILWGGSGDTTFVYSPITQIQRADELGPITKCALGFSC